MIKLLLLVLLLAWAPASSLAQAPGSCVRDSSAFGCASSASASDIRCTGWCANRSLRAPNFPDSLVNVQDASVSQAYMRVNTTGLPSYQTLVTEALVDRLNSRPRASVDFDTGRTTANASDVIAFGEDIGYLTRGCSLGYWPPGPMCPGAQTSALMIPLAPTPATQACYTGLGPVGVLVNGVLVFNFWDGQRYRSNRWLNVAVRFEAYDLDICEGHAAGDQYHHHGLSPCLARQLGDYPGGDAHSPLYGFAADGYPIYGPWQAADVLARSCWKTRDYSLVSSPTGCGVAGQRSCVLVDQYDPSRGTTTLASGQWGPRTDQTVTTQSGNSVLAVSGVYYEDYYFDHDCAASGDEEALDEHNGHSHGDLGYHYHVTVERSGVEEPYFTDVFPGWFGPGYAGALGATSFHPRGGTCGGVPTENETPAPKGAHSHGKRHYANVN